MTFGELYPMLEPGELLRGTEDPRFRDAWATASAEDFRPREIGPARTNGSGVSLGGSAAQHAASA